MTTLTFQNTAMTVINQNNKTFFSATDLGNALEYADPAKAIVKIYDRNADEFTPEMTALIEMQTNGGKQQVRIFSLRGAHLIAMFARTKVAKDFRKWVLDILDKEVSQNNQQIAPLALPPKKYTFEFTEDELLDLAWAWFAFLRGIHTFRHIYPVFEKLGSNMAGNIYGQGFEYTTTARNAHKVINRLTKDFQYDYDSNWRVLKHIRSFDPTFKTSVL